MRVRWLRKALHNLDREAAYIARDDANAARLVVERVLVAVAMLAGAAAGTGNEKSVASSKLSALIEDFFARAKACGATPMEAI